MKNKIKSLLNLLPKKKEKKSLVPRPGIRPVPYAMVADS